MAGQWRIRRFRKGTNGNANESGVYGDNDFLRQHH